MDKLTDIAKRKEKKRILFIEDLLEQAKKAVIENKFDYANMLIQLSQAYSLVLISEKMDRLVDAITGDSSGV